MMAQFPQKKRRNSEADCPLPEKVSRHYVANDYSTPITGILAPFDHWWYTEYSDDILDTLRERELKRKPFLDKGLQRDYRDQYVGLIRRIGVAEKLSRSTVHLAVYTLDACMENHIISHERLPIVSMCSILLAAKIEERDRNVPKIINLNAMTDVSYPLSDFVEFERKILKFFDFQMIIPTAATFLEYYIEGIVDEEDYEISNSGRFHSWLAMKRELADFALEFLDLMLLDVYMVQELPSKMAAACLAAARSTLEIGDVWPNQLLVLTKYSLTDIASQTIQLMQFRSSLVDETAKNELSDSHGDTPESGYLSHADSYLNETDSSDDEYSFASQ